MNTSATKSTHRLLLLTCLVCFSAASAAARQQTLVASGPVFTESAVGSNRLRVNRAGKIYVLNSRDSSILVYGRDFKLQGRIGSFGQGPDELKRPQDFAIEPGGNLVIADSDNHRIQIFSPDGKPIRYFKVSRPVSVDVLSTGEILVVSLDDDKLIRVFAGDGRPVRTIGEPVPTDAEGVFPALHRFVNRGRLMVGQRDHIYWTGNALVPPVVREYDGGGQLLKEFHPEDGSFHDRVGAAREFMRQAIESRQVKVQHLLHGAQVDRASGDIWVLPAAPYLQIYGGDGKLKQEYGLKIDANRKLGGGSVLILGGGRFIVSNHAVGCYLFNAAASLPTSPQRKRPS